MDSTAGGFSGFHGSGMKRIHLAYISLGVLLVAGLWLRLERMNQHSPFHDEINMLQYVQGLLTDGYPYKQIGAFRMPINTAEILPFPIAVSTMVFGFNDFAVKLPAVLFGTAVIALLFLVGKTFFNEWVGLFAALIYTFHPQSIIWAQNLYHPQQTQLLALATSYFFYCAIRNKNVATRDVYLAALMFALTYSSWAGTGFLLPSLFVATVAVRGADFSWLRNRHVWIATGLIGLVVIGQLWRRILVHEPYLVVGRGLSDLSRPVPFFLDAMYDPFAFVTKFLWIENNAVLTITCLLGIPLMLRNRPLRFYGVLVIGPALMLTNLFPRTSYRYFHYLEVFLILVAAATCVLLVGRIVSGLNPEKLWTYRALKVTSSAMLLGLVFVLSNTFFLKPHQMVFHGAAPHPLTRLDVPYIDYRSSVQFLQSRQREGDRVVSIQPYANVYYGGVPSDYYMETVAAKQIYYDVSGRTPRLVDKFIGTPVIRSLAELTDVLNRHERVWVLSVSKETFDRINGREVVDFLERHATVAYESYDARVYLWER
jgi:hypothetical protein